MAEADDKFIAEEREAALDALKKHGGLTDEDLPIVLKAIEQAAKERIEIYSFAREAAGDLDDDTKKALIEDLFRVACVDGDLAVAEHEQIRQIAQIFHVEHRDFIAAKIKAKKEAGMKTADG